MRIDSHVLRMCSAALIALGVSAPTQRVDAQSAPPTLEVLSDTSMRQLLKLRDGSVILGRIAQSWGDSARVESMAGVLILRQSNVSSVTNVLSSSIHDGVYWPDDPNMTRLFFAPTGRTLKKGEGYFANHWLFLMDGYTGVTDRLTLGGAMTLFPSDNFLKNNVYFISPKFAITRSERFHSAVGVFAGMAPFVDEVGSNNSFGIAYGVATWGGENGGVTVGTGFGFAEGKMARNPMVMVGGTRRVSKHVAFVTENWLFPNVDNPITTLGISTVSDKMSWDLGFVTVLGVGVIVPVPWIGVAWKR